MANGPTGGPVTVNRLKQFPSNEVVTFISTIQIVSKQLHGDQQEIAKTILVTQQWRFCCKAALKQR